MTTEELHQLLNDLWHREKNVDEVWEIIEGDRELVHPMSEEFWLPLVSTEDLP